jgi:hypothetical protein
MGKAVNRLAPPYDRTFQSEEISWNSSLSEQPYRKANFLKGSEQGSLVEEDSSVVRIPDLGTDDEDFCADTLASYRFSSQRSMQHKHALNAA